MTTVEIVFAYTSSLDEPTLLALAKLREVYGIRSIALNREEATLTVDYDATRLNPATVARLVTQTGLQIAAPVAPEPAPTPVA